MAGTESVGELLKGWSYVVHRPSEDPEPSELPSTVDMAAFSTELNAEPTENTQVNNSSDSESDSDSDSNNSGSDESGSCSQSDSSDSDSSSSSQDSASRPASPEFSVTSSQTNGLRLTIQTVRKSCNSPVDKPASKAAGGDAKPSDKNIVKSCNLSSSSSAESDSECESESGDKSDNNSNSKSSAKPVKDVVKKYGRKVRTKAVEKKHEKKAATRKDVNSTSSPKVGRPKTRSKRNQKMASLPVSRGSTYSSSDSDDSDADSAMLASCSLQEINQEDLAAILPDQQEIDTFGGFECRADKNSSQTVIEGDASGSDMELPQQAVNALIQRTTESSSECESHAPPNPSTLYANSLLQQFVAQTQLLNAPSAAPPSSSEIVGGGGGGNLVPLNPDVQNNSSADIETIKRKRGRPRKFHKGEVKTAAAKKTTLKVEYSADPNVSPDSGIQNSPDHVSSPEASPIPNTGKTKFAAANQTEKKNGASNKKPKAVEATKTSNTNKTNNLASKLKEQNKLPVTSNRFDRVLYGNTDRVLYPPRRKVGRPPIHRKGPGRPPKHKPAQSIPVEASNKASESAGVKNTTTAKPSVKVEQPAKATSKNKKPQKNSHDKDIVQITSTTHNLSLGKLESKNKDTTTTASSKKSKILSLNEICERVSRRLEQSSSNKPPQKAGGAKQQEPPAAKLDKNHKTKTVKNHHKISFPTKNKMDKIKSKYTTIKNAKLMHSKHKHKKHKKCKFKILKPLTSAHPDPKLHGEVEKLVQDFMKCLFISPKAVKEPVMEIIKVFKKTSKKRKASEHTERKKGKKQNTTSSVNKETNSNEQRLPLKKRHYHLSASNDSVTPVNNTEPPEPKLDKKLKENKLPVPAGIKNVTEKKQECAKSPPTTNNLTKTSLPLVKVNCASPKAPGINNNNNEYEVKTKSVGSHIDEAIEACITRYSSSKDLGAKQNVKEEKAKPEGVMTAVPEEKSNIPVTTPKKRHLLEIANNSNEVTKLNLSSVAIPKNEEPAKIKATKPLENVVSEIKMKRNLSPKFTEPHVQKKAAESVAQIITRKKNRLEDLTSSLVSKITPPPPNDSPEPNNPSQKRKVLKLEELCTRASVIKYPICKKAKPAEPEKQLDSVVDEKPTGIFTPTVDLELHIPTSLVPNKIDVLPKHEIQSPPPLEQQQQQGEEIEGSDSKINSKETVDAVASPTIKKAAPLTTAAESSLRKRIRKRRAINRTGFPTVKKKKKKFPSESEALELKEEINTACDRVPKEGEKYLSFLQRTECTVSVVALEKLQLPQDLNPPVINDPDAVSKWEVLSECDSLPQEDRIEFESSELDIKHIKRLRDVSPSTSIETRSSDRLKQKRDFTPESRDCNTDDDLTLESRLEKNRLLMQKHNRLKSRRRFRNFERRKTRYRDDEVDFKKKLRDLSPASSTDHISEKRSRDDRGSSDDNKRIKRAPRWRKRYLPAGLFSDYYKEDDDAARLKRNESMSNKSRLVYNPQEHPYGLLPAPYHCGKYLRCRKLPFQLPYDLWWQHTHSQLPGRDAVPSWNYKKIRTNVYNIKTTAGTCEPQPCNCTPCDGCGDDCINRLVLAECPASHKCQNQRIQKHEWSPGIEKFMTDSKGWGVRTNLPIRNGEFILEYVGEVVSDQEFKERMATRYVNDTHHYCLHLDGGLVIDGHRMGGDGRFVNHSCQPNCEMQKWSVNGQFRMALFALRDIQAGEELTYDYNFSLFNPAEGQECKCGSDICRGVIGGKSQRVRQSTAPPPTSTGTGRVGRPRKNQAKRTLSGPKEIPVAPVAPPVIPPPQVKPLTQAQKTYILEHHCFLLRNFYKVKKVKRGGSTPAPPVVSRAQTSTPTDHGSTFLSHINALRQPRNMKTRRLAQVEDDPELHKTAKLANFLRDLWNMVVKAKDEKNQQLCNPFISLPSKRKVPEYYQRISDPIDLTVVEQNIATGIYKSPENFDADMNRLFANAVRFYGRTSELGIAATRLKKIYVESKQESTGKFESLLGEKPSNSFLCSNNKGEEEDVIRCICGMYRDEGLMIQCERCLVWQHCECVQADPSAASYHCERCTPREVDLEIPMNEYTEHGHRYYMTLLRGTLQLRQGDTVYVLRDIPIPGTDRKHTYDTIGEIKYTDLDIFRVERLWKDCKTGQRFAYGHHYLRPHETYHEPTRKFFPNEVMRVPLYEAVPVELVISHCWVMDLNTFCKGRPIGAPEEHIYICEYRVDKTARLFSKVSKSKYPLCTKSYAFERFDVRLKISRTYTPHDLDPALVKPRGRKAQDSEEAAIRGEIPQIPVVHVPIVRTRSEQKARLNKILLNLLSKLPTKQPLDVSYLLEGGRRRKKTT